MPDYKTHEDHYNELDDYHKQHARTFAKHFNNSLHPDDRAILENHAANNDHPSMMSALKKIAAILGITITTGGAGLAWWAIKWFRQ